VRRLDDDPDAGGAQDVHDRIGDLVGHALLNLEPAGEDVHDARDLGQTQDLPVGDVGDVGPAEEREQVVLAHRVELDVANHDHALVSLLEHRIPHGVLHRHPVAPGEPAERRLDPLGRLHQSVSVRILPQGGEDVTHLLGERLGVRWL
jgi:hypothetical protein